jgi:crotonobetaine/carnitine-CoA ligase
MLLPVRLRTYTKGVTQPNGYAVQSQAIIRDAVMSSAERRTPFEVLQLYPAHDETLWGLLESRASIDPSRPFLCFENKVWSYSETRQFVERAARALKARGISKGDRVLVMAPNSDMSVLLFFALARLGAILVPVNPELGVEEARYILRHADITAGSCSAAALDTARNACTGMAPEPWLADIASLAELSSLPSPVAPPDETVADDTCLILYTSGTTGFPKGVLHNQRNFVLAGEAFVERMRLQPEDRLFVVLPLFHINALFYSVGGACASGASLLIAPRFSASNFWRAAADGRATEVNILAAVGNILIRQPRSEFVRGHCIRKVYGAPVPREVDEVFRTEFGIPMVIEGYGMTEIPGACNNPFDGPHKIGSIGRPARHPDYSRAFIEMRVVDDDGNDVPDGQTGELVVRTPIVMQGYFRDSKATAEAFLGDWFLTGDLGYRDDDGYYYFVARKKDIIRRRGENVSGAELDRVIGSHPGVLEAAAIAVPSDLGEDDILVAVMFRPDVKCEMRDIAAWCAEHLAPMKRPRYLVRVDSLPRTSTHRVAKFKLKEDPTLLARAVDLQPDARP